MTSSVLKRSLFAPLIYQGPIFLVKSMASSLCLFVSIASLLSWGTFGTLPQNKTCSAKIIFLHHNCYQLSSPATFHQDLLKIIPFHEYIYIYNIALNIYVYMYNIYIYKIYLYIYIYNYNIAMKITIFQFPVNHQTQWTMMDHALR